MERKRIGTLGHFHQDGVFRPFMGVILRQLYSEPPGLDPDRGVALRIEPGRPTEHLGRNLILLECDTWVFEGVLREIPQQFAQRFEAAQTDTMNNHAYLLEARVAALS